MKHRMLLAQSLLIGLISATTHADFATEATVSLEQKAKIMATFSAKIGNATNVEQVAGCVNALRAELNTLAKNVEAPFEAKYSDQLRDPPPKALRDALLKHHKVISAFIAILQELKYSDNYKDNPSVKEAIDKLERESAQIPRPKRKPIVAP